MHAIPEFKEAVVDLSSLLSREGYDGSIVWVFRDDLLKPRWDHVWIRWPVRAGAAELAARVYEEGRRRGLVEVYAIARAPRVVFATVWFPKFPEEQVQGWSAGLKVTVSNPLREAKLVSQLFWGLISLTPGFKRFQETYAFVGSRKWASAG